MLVYHCNVWVGFFAQEVMSFNLATLASLLSSGWLPNTTPCLPGALI